MPTEYSQNYFEGATYVDYNRECCNPYNTILLSLIQKHKTHGRLLELGCAYGFFLKKAENYFETYGMDVSKFAIDKARRTTTHTKLFCGDIEKDLRTFTGLTKFEVIVALDVLEHTKNPHALISHLYSLLDDGGYLFVRVPNLSSIALKIYSLIGKKLDWIGYKDRTHVSLLDVKEWTTLFKNSGFTPKIVSLIPTKPLKKIIMKNVKRLNYLPAQFAILNDSILFMCRKRRL